MRRQDPARLALPANFALWPPDAVADFEERAAIREYDGRQTRAEAEREARNDVAREWARRRTR